ESGRAWKDSFSSLFLFPGLQLWLGKALLHISADNWGILIATAEYSGYLEHWDEPFCTNCYSKFPGLMKLGKDITLGGLEIGLLTMKKGEVARFVFTPAYAYGRQGCPPLIPPNATVMFEVEVLDFLDSDESDTFFQLTAEQQDTFPLQKVLKVADTEREFGNYLYRKRFCWVML
uniref:peptidylprolyl isomerase n=1 Tax=Buteo japonicus TaxID=224669 RepID=A0A8C0AZV1_9AVES